MRYALIVLLALAASACQPPSAPDVPDWRIATGNGAAPKGTVLPAPGDFVAVPR